MENKLLKEDERVQKSVYDARTLIGDNKFAKITLDKETYYLNITKQNKLILTK